jgi:hypothetical protein
MKLLRESLLSIAFILLFFQFTTMAQNSAVPIGTNSGGFINSTFPQGATGAPYSATRETETIQTLSDGTHITRKSRVLLYRDSFGRTRTEMFFPEPRQGAADSQDPMQIMINDPVDGVNYILTPRNHSGTRNVFRPRPVNAQPPPKPPLPSALPPPSAPQMPRPETTDLGTQVIEGMLVKGKRTMQTLPVNFEGNDQPIVVVNEAWYSEELRQNVLSKRSDPRSGETTERLTNIDRSEPDPLLFQPPADYTITEPQHP